MGGKSQKPHNGDPISMMEVSPNGEYLVSYSEKDKTIVGWNVAHIENKDENHERCKPNNIVKEERIFHMSVSNEKILAYINRKHEFSK